jgi:hypothetical protein
MDYGHHIDDRPSEADRRTSAAQPRFGNGDVLVGDVDLLFERVQLRILEDLPSRPTGFGIVGLCDFPSARFIEAG